MDGRQDEDTQGRQPCVLVPAVWRGWRRTRSFKGRAEAAGRGGAGTQEAAPPGSALTSRGGPGGGGSSRREFTPVQSPRCPGSGPRVRNKAEKRMEG